MDSVADTEAAGTCGIHPGQQAYTNSLRRLESGMATSEILHRPPSPQAVPGRRSVVQAAGSPSTTATAFKSVLIMATDVMAVIAALYAASHLRLDHPFAGWIGTGQAFSNATLVPAHLGYLAWFVAALLIVSHREGLYRPAQIQSAWNEANRTVQASLMAGLLLSGSMYMTHNTTISRALVVYLVLLTTVLLCTSRAFWRHSMHRRYERGIDTRNVLIAGPSRVGEVLRKQMVRNRRLGRNFKGFVEIGEGREAAAEPGLIVGCLDDIRALARQHFVDEIIIADHCLTAEVIDLIEAARELEIEVLVVPGFYDELTPEAPIEYLGDFPVVALHHRDDRVIPLFAKRAVDFVVSFGILIVLAPTFLLVALAVKLDSPGPVLYVSDRIGRKGRLFHCFKFRTMVADAERMKAALAAKNERDGILFKMRNDPRITRVGRLLRKYSLDELPQILNVLLGDMSLVGPRPPIASEVARYEVEHFRRLEVLPGLTGLWQVRARQDPSFERYVALDLAYVENWSLWLDLKILVKTAEVVLRGTGS